MEDPAPPVVVPRIATPRLLLRELRRSDFDTYAANMADRAVTEHLSGVVDRRAAWRSFAAVMGFWMLDGAGWWGVELRDTGEIVGLVGAFFRETRSDLEIGWISYRPFWKRGFATEAARAALAFGFETHGVQRVIAHISAPNVASIRVSQHLGMSYECDVDLYGEAVGRYVVDR